MNIRYRLLLTVGIFASLVFVVTFSVTNRLLNKSIEEIRKESLIAQKSVAEKRRESLEMFARNSMAKNLARINALLETVTRFPSLADWFAPSPENFETGTWVHAAHFLQDEDWIQFIQNTADQKLLSLIIPEQEAFFQAQIESFDEGLSWVYIEKTPFSDVPCLGILLPFRSQEEMIDEDDALVLSTQLPTVYVIYKLDHLKYLTLNPNFLQKTAKTMVESSMQGYEIDEEKFLKFLIRAKELVGQPQFEKQAKQKTEEKRVEELSLTKDMTGEYLEEILEYSNQLFLIGEATTLQQARFFGEGWPDAMSFSKKGLSQAKVFFLKSVLGFSSPFFNDREFFKAHPPAPDSFVSSGSVVIKSPHHNQVFLVNTARILYGVGEHQKESYLTIGFDIQTLLSDMVVASRHYGCIINEGKILSYETPQGLPSIDFTEVPSLLSESKSLSGFMTLGGIEYYFIKVLPESADGFYFCLFLPRKEELKTVDHMLAKIEGIASQAETQRLLLEVCSLIILWIVLSDLSKKITRPVVALSDCLHHVKTGEWDLIKIPKIRFRKNNEIKQLIDSFQDMVEGMKEKEKMSGVLNKVVSKEIAQEILKGEVQLGGEEKEVTMLFADIRGFTKLTQNMAPQDIIQLLNTCMTKLSLAIEENKGVIDKYLGDGVMALYGAPVAYKDSAMSAVISGLKMIEIIREWDEERVAKGLVPLEIGIGIHTGRVCAGNMGAQNRLNYTVIGSHVNMASRLCYATGPGELLISSDTYLQPCVGKNVEVEDKGFMSFRGFDEKKQVYKVLGFKGQTEQERLAPLQEE